MFASDIRDDAELRSDQFQQRRKFARMVRAHFHHCGLMRFIQPQQRRRHAYVIVETRLTPQRVQLLPQHRRDEFLRARLAVRSADCDDW